MLDVPLDRAGRVHVNPDLSLAGADDIYVLGDLTIVEDKNGRPLPGLAQVAKQQGSYIGRGLSQRLRSGKGSKPFVFRNRGNVAIIGRHAAVFDLGWAQFTGFIAWVLWAIIHVYLLVGFEHRILVTVQWIWRYLTYESGSRLIIDDEATDS
jgi:NADH dehydrogenase